MTDGWKSRADQADGFSPRVFATGFRHVNLGFNRGALLPDPNGALAGNGKLIRHITIRNEEELNRPVVRRFLQAAIEQAPRGEGGRRARKAP